MGLGYRHPNLRKLLLHDDWIEHDFASIHNRRIPCSASKTVEVSVSHRFLMLQRESHTSTRNAELPRSQLCKLHIIDL